MSMSVGVYTNGMSVNEFAIMHELKMWVKYCGSWVTSRNFYFTLLSCDFNNNQVEVDF